MSVNENQVSLFEALERYRGCKMKFDSLGSIIRDLEKTGDPAVQDILVQYMVVGNQIQEAGRKFDQEPGAASAVDNLRHKDLKLIRNLEILLEELDNVVREAHEELVGTPVPVT